MRHRAEFFKLLQEELEEGERKYGQAFKSLDQMLFIKEKISRYESTMSEKSRNPNDLIKIASLACLAWQKHGVRQKRILGIGSQTGWSGRYLERTGVLYKYLHDPIKEEIMDYLDNFQGQALISIGYMHKIPREVHEHHPTYNLHPGTLPDLKGKDPHMQALQDPNRRLTHVTIHCVTDKIDEGQTMLQLPVVIHTDDTPESLLQRLKYVGIEAVTLFVTKYLQEV